jgi:hypothetical protein
MTKDVPVAYIFLYGDSHLPTTEFLPGKSRVKAEYSLLSRKANLSNKSHISGKYKRFMYFVIT